MGSIRRCKPALHLRGIAEGRPREGEPPKDFCGGRGRHACHVFLRGPTGPFLLKVRQPQVIVAHSVRTITTAPIFRRRSLFRAKSRCPPPSRDSKAPLLIWVGIFCAARKVANSPYDPLRRWEHPPHVEHFQLGRYPIWSRPTLDSKQQHHIPLSLGRHCGPLIVSRPRYLC